MYISKEGKRINKQLRENTLAKRRKNESEETSFKLESKPFHEMGYHEWRDLELSKETDVSNEL